MKAKSRDTGWNADSSSTGLARVGFCLASGMRSRITSKAISGPSARERFQRARMQLAEIAEHVLRADLDGAGTSGMQPARRRRARSAAPASARRRPTSTANASALASSASAVAEPDQCRPMPLRGRKAVANAGCRDQLILRPVALEHLADLEQRHIGKAAIGIGLRRGDQTRQQARPHVGQIGRDRIGERELGLAAAEQFGMRLGDERPRHRLDHAARGQRALGAAGAQLDRREDRLARRVAAFERRHRHLVDADNAHDLLDDVGLAVHVGAPGRHRDLHHRAGAGHHEAEMAEDALHLRQAARRCRRGA